MTVDDTVGEAPAAPRFTAQPGQAAVRLSGVGLAEQRDLLSVWQNLSGYRECIGWPDAVSSAEPLIENLPSF